MSRRRLLKSIAGPSGKPITEEDGFHSRGTGSKAI